MSASAAAALPPPPPPSADMILQSQFLASLDALCLAAGPPSPSFTLTDIDRCISPLLDHVQLYAAMLHAIDTRLAIQPIGVRAMLWTMITRIIDRLSGSTSAPSSSSSASSVRRDAWLNLLSPQLYRLIMLILPKFEDATVNVAMVRSALNKWNTAAEVTPATAPFKRGLLLNVIKYVDGYTYEPPQQTEEERAARHAAKKERKKRAREFEIKKRDAKRRAKEQQLQNNIKEREDVPDSPNSAMDLDNDSDDSSEGGSSASPSSSQNLRYANRTSPLQTASEEAYATRFLENLRASQKREAMESRLRPIAESWQRWEEMEEVRQHVREQRRERYEKLKSQAAQHSIESAAHAASDAASSESSIATASASSQPLSAAVSSSPSSIPHLPLTTFLSAWLSSRNHWKPCHDSLGQEPDEDAIPAQHEVDQWMEYYKKNNIPLPSSTIPNGAVRVWTKLNEVQQTAVIEGKLLPRPPPLRLYNQQHLNGNSLFSSDASNSFSTDAPSHNTDPQTQPQLVA